MPKTITLTLDDTQVASLLAQLSTAPVPTPVPVPPSDSRLARFDQAPSDFARWAFWQSSEFDPFIERLVARGMAYDAAYTRINQQINAYMSTLKLGGYHYAGTNNYLYKQLPMDGGKMVPDINGAADAYIALRFPGVIPSKLR